LISVHGWKGSSDINESRDLDGSSLFISLIIDESMVIINNSGLLIRGSVTPRSLVLILNEAIIDWHKNEWEVIAGQLIEEPEFNPG
jgi:hypothetical protein